MLVNLSEEEFSYICSANFVPSILLNKICSCYSKTKENYEIILSEEESDIIRDLCGEQLQIRGFDITYEPTKEGIILEKLVNKFFA